MHAAEQTAVSPARPRPSYPDSSRTLVAADARTRALAEAMVRLNAEGECTEAALLREGFSKHELEHHAHAAREIANAIFVKRVDDVARPTDEDLLALALERSAALIDGTALASALRAKLTGDQIARIWPKLCTTVASRIARLPIPAQS